MCFSRVHSSERELIIVNGRVVKETYVVNGQIIRFSQATLPQAGSKTTTSTTSTDLDDDAPVKKKTPQL
ncbi:hypothetical protein L596_016238 [Steinernema carpocapsae]|uniref:Uncharacterized protein n=1 Tax=Steinernema carpocapsae TaxID=34508 RepID=A0A4U5NI01_STECR|nr:hypothetical protein L596_016238 [Steinernema carpocapsae]